MRRVCHLTSVHRADDVRITVKECASLARAGWEVHLIAQGELPSKPEGITHHPLPPMPSSRWQRMARTTRRIHPLAIAVDADIYHFHDPELIPVGLLLKLQGRKVIYDVHEDVPRDVLTKTWLPRPVRFAVSHVMAATEWLASCLYDGIVAATPTIARRFPLAKTICVRNYPRLDEFPLESRNTEPCRGIFSYIGLINRIRGINEMIRATALARTESKADIRLELAGPCRDDDIIQRINGGETSSYLHYHGCLDRSGVAELLAKTQAGLVVLHPAQSFCEALPVKMFEYIAAGLPVIVSDFPLWRRIVEEVGCGLLVDPLDPEDTARAMRWIVDHPAEARAMGQRGRTAVEQRLNWDNEVPALLDLYERIAKSPL